MEVEENKKKSSITDKEWLEIAWKYFQQHAQQRISYFNFFVIFSTILTTALVNTLQKGFTHFSLGIAIGFLQSFLSIMFWKIDERNGFLTKHSENIIKKYELDLLHSEETLKLFSSEEIITGKRKLLMTHGYSYRIIYSFFFLWGILGATYCWVNNRAPIPATTMESPKFEGIIHLKYSTLDSLERTTKYQDSIMKLLMINIEKVSLQVDSIKVLTTKSHKLKEK